MATVAVAEDNSRYDNMDATTNISGIGGGAGAGTEPDIVYQGSNSISRKVTAGGFYSDTGANRNLTTTGRSTWLVKIWLTNYGSLTTTGNVLEARLGSGTGAYYTYVIGSPTVDYPSRGGWVIEAIDPNIASHRDATTGSPSLTAVSYFAAYAQCSTSKSENLCLDAIDVGVGLYMTGGDGADTDGVFSDFVTDDEGELTNGRFGYVFTQSGVIFAYGRLIIGASSSSGTLTTTATGFTDSGVSIIWPENRAAAGFSGLVLDIGNASTVISMSRCNFSSNGTSAGEDTRSIVLVTGNSGTADFDACNFSGVASVDFTDAVTATDCVFTNSGPVDAGSGAVMTGSTVSESTVATAAAALVWDVNLDPDGYLDDMTFVKGTGTNHALELGTTSPTTVTLVNHTYSGYNASNGQNDSTIFVARTAGTVTINVNGGDTPTYRSAGATVVVNNTVSYTLTGLIADSEVRILEAGTQTEVAGVESSGTSFTYNYSYPTGFNVDIFIHHLEYEWLPLYNVVLPSTNTSQLVQQRFDRNYLA